MSEQQPPQVPKTNPIPLLVGLVVAILVMAAGVRFVYMTYYYVPPKKPMDFTDLTRDVLQKQRAEENEQKSSELSRRTSVIEGAISGNFRPVPHRVRIDGGDPIEGDINAPLKLVVFSDVMCTSCRTKVRQVKSALRSFRSDLVVVDKFLPEDAGEMNGGILNRVAAEVGKHDKFIRTVSKERRKLEPDDLMETLEEIGIPFDKQREIMAQDMPEILKNLDENATAAKKLKLQDPPVFFLNGYRLDGEGFNLNDVDLYADNLLSGKPILHEDE